MLCEDISLSFISFLDSGQFCAVKMAWYQPRCFLCCYIWTKTNFENIWPLYACGVGEGGGGRRALLGDLKRQASSERHQRFTYFYFIWSKRLQFQLVYWLRGLNSLMSYGNDFSLWKQNERRESGNINATCKTKLSMNKYLELKASRPLAYTCFPANVLTVSLILQ